MLIFNLPTICPLLPSWMVLPLNPLRALSWCDQLCVLFGKGTEVGNKPWVGKKREFWKDCVRFLFLWPFSHSLSWFTPDASLGSSPAWYVHSAAGCRFSEKRRLHQAWGLLGNGESSCPLFLLSSPQERGGSPPTVSEAAARDAVFVRRAEEAATFFALSLFSTSCLVSCTCCWQCCWNKMCFRKGELRVFNLSSPPPCFFLLVHPSVSWLDEP